jgi:hypothetical protein
MRDFCSKALSVAIVVFLCKTACLPAADQKKLWSEEQEAFLANRTAGQMLGTFNGYCSLLYATVEVAIHTESEEVNQTGLSSFFPKFYKPTWKELFDDIARQTKSTWKYDPTRNFWVFSPPAGNLPFKIELAEKWKADDRGRYMSYHPAIAPVGMDIYMVGTYSVSEEEKKKEKEADLFHKVRDSLAVQFAKIFKEDIQPKDMEEVTINGLKALHFKIAAPQTGIIWRQWVIVDSGKAFAIVSAIKPEQEKEILPDVEKMLNSFEIAKETNKKTVQPAKPTAK